MHDFSHISQKIAFLLHIFPFFYKKLLHFDTMFDIILEPKKFNPINIVNTPQKTWGGYGKNAYENLQFLHN